MSLLIRKNRAPLYLHAACEAIRTEGIYEEMTPFIRKLPPTVSGLFKFLLDKWSADYGEDFVKYLVSIITVSGDGLSEITIADIFYFIEETHGKTFDCSISRVFSVIRGFLSSGGGGLVRFFHDQINKVVEERYLSVSTFRAEINQILAGFYLKHIKPQLTGSPTTPKSDYFADYIRNVVQHQISARKNDEDIIDFTLTLRNIFFVRDRIVAEQYKGLQNDYMLAQRKQAFDKTKMKALVTWRKFASVYNPFIKEIPHTSYSMAINQIASNIVYQDTKRLDIGKDSHDIPKYWVNKPLREEEDYVLLKYTSEVCFRSATTSSEGNMVR